MSDQVPVDVVGGRVRITRRGGAGFRRIKEMTAMLEGWRGISLALLVAGTTAVSTARAQQPSPSSNQTTADAIATVLRDSKTLQGVRIEIETKNGQAILSGTVADAGQKREALHAASMVQGVATVVDKLQVVGDTRINRAQYQVAGGLFHHNAPMGGGDVIMPGGMTAAPNTMGAPVSNDMAGGNGPAPEGPAGMMGGTQASMPNHPNYAWPSYAPYPNFSAVGYPTAYPWQAWPNIGPPSPYPEVPLDWRAVTLRWDDGIWWLDFKKHYTRPFFTPYPFGIGAY